MGFQRYTPSRRTIERWNRTHTSSPALDATIRGGWIVVSIFVLFVTFLGLLFFSPLYPLLFAVMCYSPALFVLGLCVIGFVLMFILCWIGVIVENCTSEKSKSKTKSK